VSQTTHRPSPAQVLKYLDGVDLPMRKQDLVHYAQQRAQAAIEALKHLPDHEYKTMAEVLKGLGGTPE
jgi:hypothetical protein